jgi:myo-inositol-1(or 4)-monophosphatase
MSKEAINYQKVIDFIVLSGQRLSTRAGKIKDIGITKSDLTEEDLAIERGLKEIVVGFGGNPTVYAEEENDVFNESDDLWVIDPISGTHRFIKGESHYSIVVSHFINHKPVFAAVYDPSVKELFTAHEGKGSFLNGNPIRISQGVSKVTIRPSTGWKDPISVEKVKSLLIEKRLTSNTYSIAVNYCDVARGKVDGIVVLQKDTFPEFAGGLIIREAGGKLTNLEGSEDIKPTDRIFIGGNLKTYHELLPLVRKAMEKPENKL